MSAPVEDRLRRALAQQAETTTTSPDGWRSIQARVDERRRRPAFLRWTVLAPAAVVVTVVAVLLVSLAGDSDDRSLRVTGDTGRLHLAPTGVEDRFRLVSATTEPPTSPPVPWTFRAFGRRAADGFTLSASVVVVLPADRARAGATPEPAPLRALGQDVAVSVDPMGQRVLTWTQPDGRTVGVMTYGLSQTELVALAESLLRGDAAKDAPALPAGFASVHSGTSPGPVATTVQSWEASDGVRFRLTVADDPVTENADLAWWLPGGRPVELRGTTGIYRAQESLLVWMERPGTVVWVQASGLSEREVVDIANGLRTVDEGQWQALTGTGGRPVPPVVSPDIGPPPGVTPRQDVYFLIVPVKSRFAPPCSALVVGAIVPERRNGQEVACYEVAAPYVDADEVASARVRENGTTGTWSVELTLTPDGAANLDRLFRDLGAGGQFAFLVDWQVVSAPRFGEVAPAGQAVVTGLDEQTARSLADRLRR